MARGAAAPPTTFTIGFPGHGDVLDERRYAAESARLIGTDHHDTAMAESDFLAELARCVPRLEEPCGIPSAPALLQLSRFAAADVKVVLAGQGADEPHGGYGRHQAAAAARGGLRHLPPALAGPAATLARALPRAARARRVAHLLGRPRRRRAPAAPRGGERRARCAARSSRARGGEAEAERLARAGEVLADVAGRGLLEQALYLDTRMFLPDGILICNDKMSMAAGLELRVPFLDLELMRFVERIPASRRVRPRAGSGSTGWRCRGCCRRRSPRARSTASPPPTTTGCGRRSGEEVRRRYAAGSALAELVEPGAVTRLVDEHRRGRADHKAVLYCLLELSEWHHAFVEAREPVAA